MFILRKDKATQLQSSLQTLETCKHAPWAALLPTLPVAQAAGAGDGWALQPVTAWGHAQESEMDCCDWRALLNWASPWPHWKALCYWGLTQGLTSPVPREGYSEEGGFTFFLVSHRMETDGGGSLQQGPRNNEGYNLYLMLRRGGAKKEGLNLHKYYSYDPNCQSTWN